MSIPRLLSILTIATAILAMAGCDDNENERLVDMAERHLQRQADTSRQMAELQAEVAEGARQLVEADAKARQEMVSLHREVQSDRAEVSRQRDLLEDERRRLSARRNLDPIVATAITNVGLLLSCLLPLVVCWYLLHRRIEPADDSAVAEVMLQDLVAQRPLLLPRASENPAITFRGGRDAHLSSEDSDNCDEAG